MIMNKVLTILMLAVLMISCGEQDKIPDLSFSGIAIGEPFPDSLKNNGSFRFSSDGIPYYEGKIKFKLPSNPDRDLSVVAAINENKEVISIQIGNMTLAESSDFFDMLKSKYGLPISDYGDTDYRLQTLLDRIYKQLGYTPYDCDVDISGHRVIAVWKSPLHRADILMIADTYHYPYEFEPELNSFVWFKYVDEEEFIKAENRAERDRLNKSRNDYRDKNKGIMNQDF